MIFGAFERMVASRYGRVVLTGSIGGLYSMPSVVNYAVSKSGMIGLNNIIAIEGRDAGVKSNIVLPGAVTRMAEGLDISTYPPMPPELVAPVVGFLAHESCPVSGEMYVSVAGRIARAFITETEGVYRPDWTVDTIAEALPQIRDATRQWTFHPVEQGFERHLEESFAMARRAQG